MSTNPAHLTSDRLPSESLPPGIGRGLRWRALPTVLFILNLLLLLVAGVVAITMEPRRPQGLPDDATARAVRNVLAGRVRVATSGLRWRAAVLGGRPVDDTPSATMLARVAEGRLALEGVIQRHSRDPRALAALAALQMAEHDHVGAARRYRAACERAPHYGEGHLGLGVALALLAERSPEFWERRRLRLEAIAQFAAVDMGDSLRADALYNRALILVEVNRASESARFAREAVALEPNGPWSARLRELSTAR